MECKAWSVRENGEWGLQSVVGSVGMWSVSCGVQSVESEVGSAKC